jgi:hypothetical protein
VTLKAQRALSIPMPIHFVPTLPTTIATFQTGRAPVAAPEHTPVFMMAPIGIVFRERTLFTSEILFARHAHQLPTTHRVW